MVSGDEIISFEDILRKSVYKADSGELFVVDNTVTPQSIVSLSAKMRNYTGRRAHIEHARWWPSCLEVLHFAMA